MPAAAALTAAALPNDHVFTKEAEIAVFAEAMKPVHEQFRSVIGSDLLNKTYQIIDSFN